MTCESIAGTAGLDGVTSVTPQCTKETTGFHTRCGLSAIQRAHVRRGRFDRDGSRDHQRYECSLDVPVHGGHPEAILAARSAFTASRQRAEPQPGFPIRLGRPNVGSTHPAPSHRTTRYLLPGKRITGSLSHLASISLGDARGCVFGRLPFRACLPVASPPRRAHPRDANLPIAHILFRYGGLWRTPSSRGS